MTTQQTPTADETVAHSIRAFRGIEVGLGQADPTAAIARKLEAQHPGHLILVQAGKFLHGFDRTAYALNVLKQYKLQLVGTAADPHLRAGFPASNFKRRLWPLLAEFGIPYVVALGTQADGHTIYVSSQPTGNAEVLAAVSEKILAEVIAELRQRGELNKAAARQMLAEPDSTGFMFKARAAELDTQLLQDVIKMPRDLRSTYGESQRTRDRRISRRRPFRNRLVDGSPSAHLQSSQGDSMQQQAMNHDADQTTAAIATAPADLFVTVPETTLPGGIVVPAFRVGQFACSRGADGKAAVTADGTPWVDINYHEAVAACLAAGYKPITERQWLAMAWNASQQDCNWTKGKVGEGKLYRGLRKSNVRNAQPGTYTPIDAKERRWLTLSNGERVFDINGNVWQWIFDDVQGDDKGLTTIIKADSPSLTTAPYPSEKKGMGYRPTGECNWSGIALVRGGCWCSGSRAGAFGLNFGWPDARYGVVGFRCTQPIGD